VHRSLLWVRSFNTIEELRLALLAFKETYNRQWRIGRYGYHSPEKSETGGRQGGLTFVNKLSKKI